MKKFKDIFQFSKQTFTKKWVGAIIAVALFDLQLTYILAFLGREQIAETLSGDICKVVIGTMLGYLAKAFFETREEELIKLEKEESEWTNSQQ